MGKGKRICRLFAVIFVITSIGFAASKLVDSSLGVKAIGQIRGYGFYNLLSGIIFGMGIIWAGGCILGTLRQLGEGNLAFLVTLISFIPGMLLVVHVLDPILEHGYDVQKVVLPQLLGLPALPVALIASTLVFLWYWRFLHGK